MKKYVVELTSEERRQLEELIKKDKVAGYKIRHAQMLLKADQGKGGPGWHDKQIADAFVAHLYLSSVSGTTVTSDLTS